MGEKKGEVKRLNKAFEGKLMTIERTISKERFISINPEDVPTLSEWVTERPLARKHK